MQPNGLINLFVNLPPAFNIVRRKPAAHALGLQVGMQPLGKLLVVGRVANDSEQSPKCCDTGYPEGIQPPFGSVTRRESLFRLPKTSRRERQLQFWSWDLTFGDARICAVYSDWAHFLGTVTR